MRAWWGLVDRCSFNLECSCRMMSVRKIGRNEILKSVFMLIVIRLNSEGLTLHIAGVYEWGINLSLCQTGSPVHLQWSSPILWSQMAASVIVSTFQASERRKGQQIKNSSLKGIFSWTYHLYSIGAVSIYHSSHLSILLLREEGSMLGDNSWACLEV